MLDQFCDATLVLSFSPPHLKNCAVAQHERRRCANLREATAAIISDDGRHFVSIYCHATGRTFTPDEIEDLVAEVKETE